MVTVIVAVTSLLHIYLPHPTVKVANVREHRDKVRNQIELLKDSLNSIAIDEDYSIVAGKNIWNKVLVLKQEENILHKEYIEIRQDATIFGFYSPHKFIYHFGIGLVLLVLALDMLRTLPLFKGAHRKARTFGAFTALTIAGYHMAWVFYVNDDLPKQVYLHILLSIGVLSGLTGIFIAQVRRKNIMWLKYKILIMLSELKNSQIRKVFKVAINGNLYDEAYQEALKESSKELSNKMQEQADEIIKF